MSDRITGELISERGSNEAENGDVFTLLASSSCSAERTDAAETVDLVHTGGAVGTG